jgi:hypothetical protein
MKLNKIKKLGYYTNNLETRETIYEVIYNTEEPECKFLIDTWDYYDTRDGSKVYKCDGTLREPRFADDIEVFEIKDTKYEVFGNSGAFLREVGKSYKERLTCKKDCDYWNEYDQDCECLGENHPCPRKCYIFKEKYPEKFPSKKCKTLTEQWRDGKLFGFHYVKEPKEKPEIHNVSCMDYLLDEYGVEVLAHVPSYDEYVELLKKLDKLKKQLDKAELVLKSIALNLTTDPKDMRVAIKDWCCDQACLNLVNNYFEGKEEK